MYVSAKASISILQTQTIDKPLHGHIYITIPHYSLPHASRHFDWNMVKREKILQSKVITARSRDWRHRGRGRQHGKGKDQHCYANALFS